MLAQLDELRRSRARIVETGDAERRRLERNLHDGAQQRLLARLVRPAAGTGRRRERRRFGARRARVQAAEGVDGAIGELRELADGIYPAILTEAGLGAALESLAERGCYSGGAR